MKVVQKAHAAISNHLSIAMSMSPDWMVAQNRFNCIYPKICKICFNYKVILKLEWPKVLTLITEAILSSACTMFTGPDPSLCEPLHEKTCFNHMPKLRPGLCWTW